MDEEKKLQRQRLLRWGGGALGLLIVLVLLWNLGGSLGEGTGTLAGTLTGGAVGSFRGATEGYGKGYDEAREEGLLARDVEVQLKTSMEKTGSLRVLVAGVGLTDARKVGKDYSALYRIMGEAVFTVDLAGSTVALGEDGVLRITLPQPEMEFFENAEKTEKLAEYQKYFFTGDAEAGYEAYLNSKKEILKNVKAHMSGYADLLEQARRAAVRQTELLARSVSGQTRTVQVDFAGKEG